MDIFVGQTNLRLTLATGQTLTGSSSLLIKFKKPDNTTGSWTATIDGGDATKMYFDIDNASYLDIRGKWIFWAYVVFSGGTIGIGKAVAQIIKNPGEV
jgi:hypothetical protein